MTWTSDQRYFSASPVQKTLNAWVQGEARHSRGGENVGGGFWLYAPTHFVQLGGAADGGRGAAGGMRTAEDLRLRARRVPRAQVEWRARPRHGRLGPYI